MLHLYFTDPDSSTRRQDQGPRAATAPLGPVNLMILAVCCAVAALILATVVLAVCLVRRHRKRKRKDPPRVEYDAEAHENPTYMRADEVPPRRTLPETPGSQTELVQHNQDNDDYLYPVKYGLPFDEDDFAAAEARAESKQAQLDEFDAGFGAAADYRPPPPPARVAIDTTSRSEKANLVENLADEKEIVLNVREKARGTVAYVPNSAEKDSGP